MIDRSSALALAWTALAVGLGAPAAQAQDVVPLDVYGALPAIEFVQISPSGDRLAYVTVAGDQRALMVTRLADGEMLSGARVGDAKVRDVQWVGEDAVLSTTSTTESIPMLGVGKTEFFMGQIHDLNGRPMRQVFEDQPGVWPIMVGKPMVRQTPEGVRLFVGGYNFSANEISLFGIDPSTGITRRLLRSDFDIETDVLSPDGVPIARSKYDERRRQWTLYIAGAGERMRLGWTTQAPVDSPRLLGLGRTNGTVLVNAQRPDLPGGTAGEDTNGGTSEEALHHVFEVDVVTGTWTRLEFETHPTFLIHHPRSRLLIGSGRIGDEATNYTFIDPSAARIWSTISRAFDGRVPELVSWSDDLRSVVVRTGGSGDSGGFHLVDLDARVSRIVGETYPALPPEQVGTVRAIEYTAGDGLEIHGYLTMPPGVTDPKNLPLIVLAHGGPASRDAMGFDWWAQAMASRGYVVLQANFRGSSGYGQDFLEAGYGEWGRKMQTDLSDGVRWLAAQGVVDPARVCIVGASYGGYAALAGATLDRSVYRCAVSVAGVSDLRRMLEWEAQQGPRRDNQTVRYWNRFMGVERSSDPSLEALSPAKLAGQVQAPVMLLHGRDDTVVPIEQSRFMASALRAAGKPHEMIELSGEDHWLSRADTRQRMLTESLRFLEAHNPTD
jgi:acetyl esterase/lipase